MSDELARERAAGPFIWYCANPACPLYRKDSGQGNGEGPRERMCRNRAMTIGLSCEVCCSSLYWTCGLPGQLDILIGEIIPEATAPMPSSVAGTKKRVLCPVTTKDGKTFWVKMGNAYVNADGSINIYLDGLPVNGRLQIRDEEEEKDPSKEKG